mmetsp:Transcript_34168/g.101964  ORF Transcript_34168/g.101964 Transcript_34168/m.101964 type:complete len:253 (+) Transcript_34168:530-1288(+)
MRLVDPLLIKRVLFRRSASRRGVDGSKPGREARVTCRWLTHIQCLEVGIVGVEAGQEADERSVGQRHALPEEEGPGRPRAQGLLEPLQLLKRLRPQRRLFMSVSVVQPLVAVGVEGATRAHHLLLQRGVLGRLRCRVLVRELAVEHAQDVQALEHDLVPNAQRGHVAPRRHVAQVGLLFWRLSGVAAQVHALRRVAQPLLLHEEEYAVAERAPRVRIPIQHQRYVAWARLPRSVPCGRRSGDAVPREPGEAV